jgi:hypothetical protein
MEVIGMLSSHPVRIAKCGTVATSGVQKASKLEKGKEFPSPLSPARVIQPLQFNKLCSSEEQRRMKRFSGFLGLIVSCASLCADWRSSCF